MKSLNLYAAIFCSVAFGMALMNGDNLMAVLDVILVAVNVYLVQKQIDKLKES